MARNTEVAASHISNLENGKANPTLGLLVQLADGLNCTVPDLLKGP
ncbi:helix-turn-helix domain-containing protein [Novosphingobium sp. P6W]|nr:helix-turn-helix transcriptional regulator [Novosphingobium sp. P6W]